MPVCMTCGAFFTGKQCDVCIATSMKKPKTEIPSPTALIAKQEAEMRMPKEEKLEKRVKELQQQVDEKEEQIRQLDGQLSRKTSELEHEIKSRDKIISELKSQLDKPLDTSHSTEIAHKNEQIMDLSQQVKNLEAKIITMQETKKDDHSSTEIRHLNETIMDLNTQLKAQEAQFKMEINQRDDKIQELQLKPSGNINTKAYEDEMNELRAQIRKKDAIIATHERKIVQLEQKLNE